MSSIPPTDSVGNPPTLGALPSCASPTAEQAVATRLLVIFHHAGIPMDEGLAAMMARDLVRTFLAHADCAHRWEETR